MKKLSTLFQITTDFIKLFDVLFDKVVHSLIKWNINPKGQHRIQLVQPNEQFRLNITLVYLS